MPDKIVAIFGTGRAQPGDSAYKLAQETGKLLARAGFTIANGGYGGTMTAAAKGAAEAGGEIIGVTCSAFKGKANKYVSSEITTASLDERLDTLIKLGQFYIVLPGGTGTLLELAKVWELKNKGFLEPEKHIILIGKFWKPLVELLNIDDPDCGRHVIQVDEPKQAIKLIMDNC
jgi:uncharacterized protein (TIGR00730 family)